MRMYIGLDVHSKQTTYVVQDEQGRVLEQGEFPTSEEGLGMVLNKLQAPPGTTVGLETGTQAQWVAGLLAKRGMNPQVIDAREVRAKARRVGQKSDSRDAFEICDGLRRDIYQAIVYLPPAELQRLRRIISRRRHFVRLRTGQVNAAKFLLRQAGMGGVTAKKLAHLQAWEELLARPEVEEFREYLARHAAVWQVAHQQVVELDEELKKALQPFAAVEQRLRTAPGVGPITAATYIAALGTPDRFPDSGHVASYIGIIPSTYDSGERERHGRITKRGNAELRAMLCEAAQQAARPANPLHPYFVRVCAKSGYKKAVVTVAHRLARILWQMWRKKEDFDEKQLNVEYTPKVVEKVVLYRLKRPALTATGPGGLKGERSRAVR